MEPSPIDLDELILHVTEITPSQDQLGRVTEASRVSQQLNELADRLIGHFVDEAREAGASWAEIGQSIGVSKQAAQQRFVRPGRRKSPVLSRFTVDAREAVTQAQEEARRNRSPQVETEHLVLGLLDQTDSPATQALTDLGAPVAAIREEVAARIQQVDGPEIRHPRFSPAAKKVLELSLREAIRDRRSSIGSDHLLLGLLRERDSLGARILIDHGVSRAGLERWVGHRH